MEKHESFKSAPLAVKMQSAITICGIDLHESDRVSTELPLKMQDEITSPPPRPKIVARVIELS
jgi:hypothetical protein